jgi:hypothetical protein
MAGAGRQRPGPGGEDAGKWVDPGPAVPAQDAWFQAAPQLELKARRGAAEALCTPDAGRFAERSCAAPVVAVTPQPEAGAQPDGWQRVEQEASLEPHLEVLPASQPGVRQPRVAAAQPGDAVERRW